MTLLGLLAHQGGWDEILMIVGPVAVVVALLLLVRRRVRERGAEPPSGERPLAATPQSSQPDDVGTD